MLVLFPLLIKEWVMSEFKLIVAGSRDFSDYKLLEEEIIQYAEVTQADNEVSIISGMARGADRLAYEFARDNDVTC